MENLEFLLNKSARLLRWYDYNKNDENFKNYFNSNFSYLRSIGYFVVCEEISSKQIEIYFRSINNPVYRTPGIKCRL